MQPSLKVTAAASYPSALLKSASLGAAPHLSDVKMSNLQAQKSSLLTSGELHLMIKQCCQKH